MVAVIVVRTLRRLRTAGLLAAVLGAACGTGRATAQESVTVLDRFALLNECAPMALLVTPVPDDAAEIGLTEERIRTMAESRLRAARLFSTSREPFQPYLHIIVTVVGPAFSQAIEYYKVLYDIRSAMSFSTETWSRGVTGTHGRDAGYILQSLSEGIDEFVLEYLRVNDDACG